MDWKCLEFVKQREIYLQLYIATLLFYLYKSYQRLTDEILKCSITEKILFESY